MIVMKKRLTTIALCFALILLTCTPAVSAKEGKMRSKNL